MTAWLSRLRPDPLKRLHLDLGAAGKELTGRARTSVPEPTQGAAAPGSTPRSGRWPTRSPQGLGKPWAAAVRRASTSRLDDLHDRLDRALGATDLGAARIPWWAGVVRVLQWTLILAALGGGVWLGSLAVMGYLQVPAPDTPAWFGVPLPTLMLLGGVGLGILLALLCRVLVGMTATARARTADRRLRAAIREVCQELVIAPVEAELSAHREVRDGLDRALA